MIKSRLITLGCVSGCVIIGGIILSLLMYFWIQPISDVYKKKNDSNWHEKIQSGGLEWISGIMYIVPGLLGFIAAFCQNKCMYVITCIFSMISILMEVLIFYLLILVYIVLIISFGIILDNCRDTRDGCKCEVEGKVVQFRGTFATCDGLTSFAAMGIATFIVNVLVCIFLVAEFILASYYACCAKLDLPPQAGIVLGPAQPMLPPSQGKEAYSPPPGYSLQPYSDDPPPCKV